MRIQKHERNISIYYKNKKDRRAYHAYYHIVSNREFRVDWIEQFDTGDWFPKIIYSGPQKILPQTKITLLSRELQYPNGKD